MHELAVKDCLVCFVMSLSTRQDLADVVVSLLKDTGLNMVIVIGQVYSMGKQNLSYEEQYFRMSYRTASLYIYTAMPIVSFVLLAAERNHHTVYIYIPCYSTL